MFCFWSGSLVTICDSSFFVLVTRLTTEMFVLNYYFDFTLPFILFAPVLIHPGWFGVINYIYNILVILY